MNRIGYVPCDVGMLLEGDGHALTAAGSTAVLTDWSNIDSESVV